MDVESESRKGCVVEVVISSGDLGSLHNLFGGCYVSTSRVWVLDCDPIEMWMCFVDFHRISS